MGYEIERKFLVIGDDWKSSDRSLYRQGYLSSCRDRVVRIRVVDNKAFLTIKGPKLGIKCSEYQYDIPLDDANELLELCEQPLIEKYRYRVNVSGFDWEIDEFLGDNQGLIVAEIELSSEQQDFEIPEWIEKEVSGDYRYSNSNLIKHPFKYW